MLKMQRLQMRIGGALSLVGVTVDIARRWRDASAESVSIFKMCTLSAGSVSVAGRERGASEENVITFVSVNTESSSHLVAMQTLLLHSNALTCGSYASSIVGESYI
jgi:hypothetical protein